MAVTTALIDELSQVDERTSTLIRSESSVSTAGSPRDGLIDERDSQGNTGNEVEKTRATVSLQEQKECMGREKGNVPAATDQEDEKHVSSKIKQHHIKSSLPIDLFLQPVFIPGLESSQPSDSYSFAALSLDFQRRLQLLAVLWHALAIAILVGAFFLLCAIPLLWPLLLPYAIWLLVSNEASSGSLRRRSHMLRSLPIWSLFVAYFPVRLHRSQELPPTRKYIFGYHPHGIISHGAWSAFLTDACGFARLFPGITNTLLTLEPNFRLPLYRDYLLSMGLASVARDSCERLLNHGGTNGEGMGRAITIVVGGARESLSAEPHSMTLVLRRRKGFVRLAVRTGADLVPVLCFGENELYQQVTMHSHPMVRRAQILLKQLLGFTIPLFHARGVFNRDTGLLPYRRPLNVVVGRPIKVMQKASPDERLVDEIHARYVAEVERLWAQWKDVFLADSSAQLRIVE